MEKLKKQGWLLLASLITTILLTSCGSDSATTEAAEEVSNEVAEDSAPIMDAFSTDPVSGANYGAGVPADAQVLSYPAFAASFEGRDSLTGVIQGEVMEVCQKKGCWMSIQPSVADGADDITVRFKDYGFFMPKELSGNKVLVEGTAKRRVIPVDELRHYAEDAGKSADEIAMITEPEEEVEFTATGVRVL